MAEPASKRVKTSHNKNDKRRIVAFSSPGLKPDACFKVFDSLEFHVHSDILKLHSGFFRQILVAMNIADYPRVNSAFTYRWVAVFDEDRARWSVTPDRGDVPPFEMPKSKGVSHEVEHYKEDFERLLWAFYNKPYTLNHVAWRLNGLANIARCYAALPPLSRTLDGALHRSPEFVWSLFENSNACCLLKTATQLTSAKLFRECLFLTLGPWDEPVFKTLEDPKMKKLAQNIYNRIAAKISATHADLAVSMARLENVAQRSPKSKFMKDYMFDAALTTLRDSSDKTGRQSISLPVYYRKLYDVSWEGESPFKHLLEPIFRNNLALIRDAEAGKGQFKNYFLCGEIEDEDLPWDITEEEW